MRGSDLRILLFGTLGLACGVPTFAQTQRTAPRPAAPAAGQGAATPTRPAAPAPAPANRGAAAQAPRPAAAAAPLPPPQVVPDGARKMEALLAEWEKRSQQDETLFAKFIRRDKQAGLPEELVFEGVALLKRPNKACLEFKEKVEGQPTPAFHDRIVATGEEVYHIFAPTRQVFIYPLAPDARRRALEEGPLPFMFNFRVAEAKQRYEMYLVKETPGNDKEGPTFIVDIRPRTQVDREEFIRAFVLLDRQTFLPKVLRLESPNQKDTKTFFFTNIVRNGNSPAVKAENYDGKKMASDFQKYGYKVIYNPDANGQPAANPAAAPAQPAMRGQPAPGRRQ